MTFGNGIVTLPIQFEGDSRDFLIMNINLRFPTFVGMTERADFQRSQNMIFYGFITIKGG